jgi:hypothetical protein
MVATQSASVSSRHWHEVALPEKQQGQVALQRGTAPPPLVEQ